ncbi:MAG TPA: metal ABC transporter permease [Deltaproteobacteria bacterium]|nr:metal ABC transporter permease [Deltaproteobacteria bacterium]HPP80031.1 metal ABC transporter permease [Deltaproteobacteria bacterium]
MTEFFADLPRFEFLQNAVMACVLAGLACGVMGSYVVTRRISSVAGAIAHSILGGLGAARYCQVVLGWTWFTPMTGAVLMALASALVISWVRVALREREDTVIQAVWAVGMAIGLLFIFKTPGYNEDLMSYLFGSILMVTQRDLWVMAGLDVMLLVVCVPLYSRMVAVCFDEEFAVTRGIDVQLNHLLMICLVALTVVLLVSVAGIVMVIALLTLPAATASHFSGRLWHMMVLSGVLTAVLSIAGMAVSYEPDLPVGAVIIVLAACVYILVVITARARGIRGMRA